MSELVESMARQALHLRLWVFRFSVRLETENPQHSKQGRDSNLSALLTYVLITPARNEAGFIELTLKSVVAQTMRPLRWVIVSDGSSDGTDEIVNRYAAEHSWIELVRIPQREERNFAGKVHAFNAGYARLHGVQYDVIASMDGDISFDENYFTFLLQKLAEDPKLGLVGTPFREASNAGYDYRFVSIEHVSGACQVFRRECFEEIGGYRPIKGGGVDYIAVLTSRMKGWRTRTFTEQFCLHHREMGTAQHSLLKARFRNGVKDYTLGGHPLWQAFRAIYQMSKRPFVIGGLVLAVGYLCAMIKRVPRPIPREMVAFRRNEEMGRLKRFLSGNKGGRQSALVTSS
jgi:biofilm PGA synthesis N-glycosyltransferase PgaC